FPVSKPSSEDLEGEQDVEDYVKKIVEQKASLINFLQPAENAKERSITLQQVIRGFPEHKEGFDLDLHPYWSVRSEPAVVDGVVLHGNWVVVHEGMRRSVLDDLHAAHLRVEKTLARARSCLYWLGISHEIKAMIKECDTCEYYKASHQQEPIIEDVQSAWPGEAGHCCRFIQLRWKRVFGGCGYILGMGRGVPIHRTSNFRGCL
ncbi:hypothetical protein TCAL_13473, partial [Tigriopus californicus]